MIEGSSHLGFVVAAYAVAAVTIVSLVARAVLMRRHVRRALERAGAPARGRAA